MKTSKFGLLLFCFFLLLGSSFSALAQNRSKQIAKLEKTINSILERAQCPGISIAVVEKDQVVYLKGFGYRDYENKKPVTPNTLFAIGSCTKAFTASLIGQLEAQKQIDLDANPRQYLPELRFYKPEMDQQIMVRDLLSHSTGVPRHDRSWYYFPSDSRDSLLSRIAYHEPNLAVRESYQYNNFMYMALGAMTERITSKSWEENIKQNLLQPLDMSRTNLTIEALLKADDVAFGYATNRDEVVSKEEYYHIRGMAPAGSINSSARDMAQWVLTWINAGKYNGKEVLSEDFVHEAISSQSISSGRLPGKYPDMYFSNYGFGWSLSSYRGHYRVEHGGNIDGFTASTCFFPSDSIGIVVLANQSYSSVPAYVRNTIADKLLNLEPITWHDRLKKSKPKDDEEGESVAQVSNKIPNTQLSHPLKDYTGLFHHSGYGTLRVVLEQDRLYAQFPDARWRMRHLHYDIFELFKSEENYLDSNQGASLHLNFRTDIDGSIHELSINLESSLDPMVFERQLEVLNINVDDLKPYVGDYPLGEDVNARIFINDAEELILVVPGQPEYTLLPSKEHLFVIKDLEGYSVKFELEEGTVTSLTFIQPNGSFKVPKK